MKNKYGGLLVPKDNTIYNSKTQHNTLLKTQHNTKVVLCCVFKKLLKTHTISKPCLYFKWFMKSCPWKANTQPNSFLAYHLMNSQYAMISKETCTLQPPLVLENNPKHISLPRSCHPKLSQISTNIVWHVICYDLAWYSYLTLILDFYISCPPGVEIRHYKSTTLYGLD